MSFNWTGSIGFDRKKTTPKKLQVAYTAKEDLFVQLIVGLSKPLKKKAS
jgi:hypothetical protein